MDLAFLVGGAGTHVVQRRTPRPLRGLARGQERVLPGAIQFQDLGDVQLAGAAELDQLGLRATPACQRGRPLAGAVQGLDLAARRDQVAVHEPGHHRRQRLAQRQQHGVVEHRDAVVDAALRDQRLAHPAPGQGLQVALAAPLGDGQRLLRPRDGGVPLVGRDVPDHLRQQQVAVHRTGVAGQRGMPLRALQPRRAAARLAQGEQAEALEERPVGRVGGVAGRLRLLEQALEGRQQLVVPIEHAGRPGEPDPILARQRLGGIAGLEPLQGVFPAAGSVGLAGGLEPRARERTRRRLHAGARRRAVRSG